MIAHVLATSVWWRHDLIVAALSLHIGGGCLALVFGAAALAFRKGARAHRRSGNLFFLSLLTMAAMATLLGVSIPDWANVPGGGFTFYLVATGWATVRRGEGGIGLFNYGAILLALVAAAVAASFAVQAAGSPTGLFGGKPAPLYAIFACLAAFAAALDVKVIVRPRLSSMHRIARHVWRMCTALFFSTGSFFLGQQQVMPEFVQGSPLLIVLAVAPLPVMVYWLVRIRIGTRFRSATALA